MQNSLHFSEHCLLAMSGKVKGFLFLYLFWVVFHFFVFSAYLFVDMCRFVLAFVGNNDKMKADSVIL